MKTNDHSGDDNDDDVECRVFFYAFIKNILYSKQRKRNIKNKICRYRYYMIYI